MIKKKCLAIIVTFFFSITLLYSSSSGEVISFSVRRIGQIACFGENIFEISAPESGLLTISVRNDSSVFRILKNAVPAGTSRITWDGCGYNQERLTPMNYHIDATLEGDSGNSYYFSFDSPIEYCLQVLQFALSSADTVYLSNPDEWFLESKTLQSGTLAIEFRKDSQDTPVYTFRRSTKSGRINHMTFSEIVRKTIIEPGTYTLHIYEVTNPEYASNVILNVENDKPEDFPVLPTGRIMPESGDDDEAIWNIMIQPAVIIDIGSTDHQEVYRLPDPESESLGTLHGQTQTLCVTEVSGEWAKVEAWNHEEGEKIHGWVPLGKLKVVYPRTDYGILIDKKTQTMKVYFHGKVIETLMVSTGRMEKDALYQETSAGSYLTGIHRVDFSTNGNKYDFVIQYDGGNLLHQIPYRFGSGKKDFSEGRALLGGKASHACVRIQADPGEDHGINAYWLWTHIPYHSRIIILDDPEEREKSKGILQRDNNGQWETDSDTLTVFSDPAGFPEEGDTVILTFGGDAVLGGRENYYSRDDSLMAFISRFGYSYPFSALYDLFASDDITCINLECVLKENGTGEDLKKRWRFRGLPEYAGILKESSVEMVNLANNHTYDYGEDGYLETVASVESKVLWCGPDHPVAVVIKGHRIGFGACRETAYRNNPDIIRQDIKLLKKMNCEFIVYQCHWGTEYDPHHNAMQEAMARACIRNGADLVIGHHPHIVQGTDIIDGVPVVYSLGNLCFGGTIHLEEYDAVLARAAICFSKDGHHLSLEIIPIMTSSSSHDEINDFQPVPAIGDDAARIIYRVQSDSWIGEP